MKMSQAKWECEEESRAGKAPVFGTGAVNFAVLQFGHRVVASTSAVLKLRVLNNSPLNSRGLDLINW